MTSQPVDEKYAQPPTELTEQQPPRSGSVAVEDTNKSFWDRLWPVIACGAGLFSDGYLNGVIGSVNTLLRKAYPVEYDGSSAQNNVSSIAFAGTVVGQQPPSMIYLNKD